ncbi:hypothetical protein DFR70_105137 [Nocardia tenerifensis]|uniref:Uncharacterized protein n=1 Tax=Nocardia tenerifensis TaxID=228006 RepID=A0A318KNF1_9NOCA|nr:hypothetical protein [Nocardia tenerifensis]PXX63955.1 hypothetical protein DFR70_105137 [Nocardia tenerifensis]
MAGYGTYEIGQIAVLSPPEHQRPDLLHTVGRPVPGVRVSIRGSTGGVFTPSQSLSVDEVTAWVRAEIGEAYAPEGYRGGGSRRRVYIYRLCGRNISLAN